MRPWRPASIAVAAAAAAALAIALAGCSGGGADYGEQAQPAAAYLDDQATLAALNAHWLPVLFPSAMRESAGQCAPDDNGPSQNPDGTWTWRYTRSDCAEVTWEIAADWMAGEGRTVYPDGGVETEVFDTKFLGDADDTVKTTDTRVFPGGTRLETTYTSKAFAPTEPDPLLNSQQGTLTLSDGRRMDFALQQRFSGNELEADAHEGWVYRLDAPWDFTGMPDTTKKATGSLVHGSQTLEFTLDPAPGAPRWSTLRVTAPGGVSGLFELGATLTGQGTVKQAGQLLMTVQWSQLGKATATYADGTTKVGQPSAAAEDFLVDRWLWSLSQYGPSPR